MSTDRRHPLRPFDPAILRPFLKGRTLLSANLLSSGKSNTNYKVYLSDGSVYVLRLRHGGDGAREAYVMSLVRDIVPVPEEVARGDSWSLLTFLDGDLLEAFPEAAGAAAQALARISSIAFSSPGWPNPDDSVTPFPFAGFQGFVRMMLEDARVRAWLEDKDIAGLDGLLVRESSRFGELNADNRLVHGDFNPSNILIRKGVVSGVLDWEFAHSGTPYMDVGNLVRHLPEQAARIEVGLKEGGMALPHDWQEWAALVDLTSQLEFLTTSRSDAFKQTCVDRVRRALRDFS